MTKTTQNLPAKQPHKTGRKNPVGLSELSEKKAPFKPTEIQIKMLSALVKHRGVVTPACKECGIARDTYYGWLERYKGYAKLVKEIKAIAHDFVESIMFQRIEEGSDALIKYYLSTQAKDRGYGESLDVAAKVETVPVDAFDLSNLTPDQRAALLALSRTRKEFS